MAFELKQSMKLAQQLVMTPQLQQAIKLLQLSRLELVNLASQELQENPLTFCPPDGHLHKENLQAQERQYDEITPAEDMGKGGFKAVELAEVLEKIGQWDKFRPDHDPPWEDRDRVVDSAYEEHKAHE